MLRIKKRSGFTLLEVIVSIALIGIVAAIFLSTFTFGLDEIFSMGRKSVATKIAEQCINVYYQQVDLTGHYDHSNVTLRTAAEAEIETIRSENSQYLITPVVTGPTTDGLYALNVTVTYRNNTRTISLSAIVP